MTSGIAHCFPSCHVKSREPCPASQTLQRTARVLPCEMNRPNINLSSSQIWVKWLMMITLAVYNALALAFFIAALMKTRWLYYIIFHHKGEIGEKVFLESPDSQLNEESQHNIVWKFIWQLFAPYCILQVVAHLVMLFFLALQMCQKPRPQCVSVI